MRVIKQNTADFQTLYSSLRNTEKDESSLSYLKLHQLKNKKAKKPITGSERKNEQGANYFKIVAECEREVHASATIDDLLALLHNSFNQFLPLNESGIFILDDFNLQLNPLGKVISNKAEKFINKIYKEEILDWIFETGKPALIPDINNYTSKGSKVNFYIVPIYEGEKNKGILYLSLPIEKFEEDSEEASLISVLLSIIYPKIMLMQQKETLNNVYSDLQSYQSKLNNDYKLSAIGELTGGIMENILSPLQIIISYADILGENADNHDTRAVKSIKTQVHKIESIISRLAKFQSINNQPEKLFSCNLNELTQNFGEVIQPDLNTKNYELILDLEDNIPPILTHPDHFNQILSNIFSLIRPKSHIGGGILIQSRFVKESIHIRVISTDFYKELSKTDSQNHLAELRILGNLVKKHEGEIKFDSKQTAGTSILVKIPLKRKIRK